MSPAASPTSSPQPAPLGHRTPPVSHYPAGATDYSIGETALDIATIAGATPLDWQCDVVREGTAKDADGQWAAGEVGVLVARQNGKTATIEIVELTWMITEPGVKILHTAHEFQTAIESMGRLQDLINSHPMLEHEVASIRTGNGKEWIKLKNGSEIRYRTRTKSGGRGFKADRLVIDEAMIWSTASQAAIRPLLTTARNPQIWYLGSAADADVHVHVSKWASLREAAMSDSPPERLLWMEWSAPEPPAPTGNEIEDAAARTAWRENPDNWAAANPSLGREVIPGWELITHQYIADELDDFRNAIDEWETERLSLGRWPVKAGDIDPVVSPDGWKQMTDRKPTLIGAPAIGIELAPNRSRWAICAAQHTADDLKHVELGLFRGATLDEVVAFVLALVERWDPVAVVIDARSPAATLIPRLIAAGVEPERANTPQMARWTGGFLDDAIAQQLTHTDQPALTGAMLTVAKRTLPQGDFVLERTDDGSTAPAIAVALAHGGLIEFGGDPHAVAAVAATAATPQTAQAAPRPTRDTGALDVLSAKF